MILKKYLNLSPFSFFDKKKRVENTEGKLSSSLGMLVRKKASFARGMFTTFTTFLL